MYPEPVSISESSLSLNPNVVLTSRPGGLY